MIRARATEESFWSAPLAVSDVPESGRHIDLLADAQARAAVARLAGLRDLPRLTASFDVAPHGRGGLAVTGRVSATVGQTCVVTLEPVEKEVDEAIDLVFAPAESLPAVEHGEEVEVPHEDAPEAIIGRHIDLAAIATEFLILGIDPYPRKPDAVFDAPTVRDDSAHPFAALAALKKERGGKRGRR